QDFDGGSHQKLSLMTSTNGTFELNDLRGFWGFYNTNNGGAAFGYLLSNAFPVGSGTRQDFSRGSLIWDAINGISWNPVRPVLATNKSGCSPGRGLQYCNLPQM